MVLLEMLEVPEVMYYMLLCMLEAVDGGLFLSVMLEVPEIMC
jgi:hypothetical protein